MIDFAGAILELYAFDAYGNAIGFDPSVALTEFLYSGEQFDSKIGQQYLRARYYNPVTGRFNRLDPFFGNLNDPQSLHKYLYTHADPVNKIDPSGKSSIFYLLTSLLDAQVSVSSNKYVKPVDLIEIDEKWSDNYHATVILWINTDGAPSIFKFSDVHKRILEIFENTKIKVLVIQTSQTREQIQDQLGPQYDRSLHIINYPWYTAKGGPVGWILGGINVPWYYATRWQKNYGYHIIFNNHSELGMLGQGGRTTAVIYGKSSANTSLWQEPPTDWSIAFANIIVHESFWHGICGHTWHKGEEGSFGATRTSDSKLFNLKEYEDEILWELR